MMHYLHNAWAQSDNMKEMVITSATNALLTTRTPVWRSSLSPIIVVNNPPQRWNQVWTMTIPYHWGMINLMAIQNQKLGLGDHSWIFELMTLKLFIVVKLKWLVRSALWPLHNYHSSAFLMFIISQILKPFKHKATAHKSQKTLYNIIIIIGLMSFSTLQHR